MTPLAATELRAAEAPDDDRPYELCARDFNVLGRAVLHYLDHLEKMSREMRRYGGAVPHDVARDRIALDDLHNRIIAAHAITITPDR